MWLLIHVESFVIHVSDLWLLPPNIFRTKIWYITFSWWHNNAGDVWRCVVRPVVTSMISDGDPAVKYQIHNLRPSQCWSCYLPQNTGCGLCFVISKCGLCCTTAVSNSIWFAYDSDTLLNWHEKSWDHVEILAPTGSFILNEILGMLLEQPTYEINWQYLLLLHTLNNPLYKMPIPFSNNCDIVHRFMVSPVTMLDLLQWSLVMKRSNVNQNSGTFTQHVHPVICPPGGDTRYLSSAQSINVLSFHNSA